MDPKPLDFVQRVAPVVHRSELKHLGQEGSRKGPCTRESNEPVSERMIDTEGKLTGQGHRPFVKSMLYRVVPVPVVVFADSDASDAAVFLGP